VALVLDPEAGGFDRPLGVTVRVTSPGDSRPGGLQEILQPGLPGPRRAHVLEHPELAVRPQHPLDLQQTPVWIGDAAEDEAAQDRVEGGVAERERLGASDHQRDLRGATAGAL
jgi:hypothetical protein